MSDKDFMQFLFPDILVREIAIKEITPCAADPDRIKFLAQADKQLGDILPILYLYIPNAKYSEKLGTLGYNHKRHLITIFSSGRIGMTYVKDRKEAEELIEEAKNLINRAFIYLRSRGTPDTKLFELKKGTNPITVYEKLPKNNCKECGEEGCYAFGVKLLTGEKEAEQCPHVNVNELKRMLSPITI